MNSIATPDSVPKAKNPILALGNRKLLIQIATLLLVTFGAAMTGITVDQQMETFLPETKTFPSTFNRKQSGTSGMLELLNKIGLKGKQWVLPYRQLSSIHGTLVLISPSESLEDFEATQILEWVNAGNDLIYLDHFTFKMTRRLLLQLKVDATEARTLTDDVLPVSTKDSPVFDLVPHLIVSADSRLTSAPPLVSDKSGAIFSEIKYGKGRILLGTSPTLVSNRRLSDKQSWPNFQFLVNWLGSAKGSVWFDERCHGFSQNANVFIYLLRGPLGLVSLQLLTILALGILSAAQRFGRIATLENKRKISNLEFIYGLSNTYRRAKANTASLEIIGQTFRNKLCKALSVSPHETTDQVLEALRASLIAQESVKQQFEQFLRDYEDALAKQSITDYQLKVLIIRCDKITGLLEKTRASEHLLGRVV